MQLKSIIVVLFVFLCTACSATNPVKNASLDSLSSLNTVLTSSNSNHTVRWGGQVLAVEYLGKDSLVHLQVTEQQNFIRPEPAKKFHESLQIVIVTPNMDARIEYQVGDLLTTLGTTKTLYLESTIQSVIVIPDAIYSWLNLRDNREYDSTGIIAMSSIENLHLTRVIDSPWASQDETDPMMQRVPVYKQSQKKHSKLLVFQ